MIKSEDKGNYKTHISKELMNTLPTNEIEKRISLLKSISIFSDLDNALLNELANVLTSETI